MVEEGKRVEGEDEAGGNYRMKRISPRGSEKRVLKGNIYNEDMTRKCEEKVRLRIPVAWSSRQTFAELVHAGNEVK